MGVIVDSGVGKKKSLLVKVLFLSGITWFLPTMHLFSNSVIVKLIFVLWQCCLIWIGIGFFYFYHLFFHKVKDNFFL